MSKLTRALTFGLGLAGLRRVLRHRLQTAGLGGAGIAAGTAAGEADALASRALKPGDPHHRAYVGPPDQYDFMAATQFRLLTTLGLREEHHLLDIGCGSLRAGRLLIQYLFPDRYHGVEPNEWLWKTAFEKEIGTCVAAMKRPRFYANATFRYPEIEARFDFVVAQSIFSHTGPDLLATALGSVRGLLKPGAQVLFTAVAPGRPDFGRFPAASTTSGWLYPGCAAFEDAEIAAIAAANGLHAQRLPWFHPRQVWFRAVAEPERLLPDADAFPDGRVFFDLRFAV